MMLKRGYDKYELTILLLLVRMNNKVIWRGFRLQPPCVHRPKLSLKPSFIFWSH